MTGIVLAGGQGRRMGNQPKAWLNIGGQPLIFRILDRLREVFSELLVVARHSTAIGEIGVRVIGDLYPGYGPLGGIYTALHTVSSPYIFCCACDMPFMSPPLIKYMCDNPAEPDVIIPRFGGRLHPLHAIYSQSCLSKIERQLQLKDRKVISFFPQAQVKYIEEEEIIQFDPTGKSFFNINTGEDLELALEWEREAGGYLG